MFLGSKFYWTNYGKWLAKRRDKEKEKTFKNIKETERSQGDREVAG